MSLAKRFWFLAVDLRTEKYTGKLNLGYVSDENNPLNNEKIKDEALKYNPNLDSSGLVVSNIFEFKNEEDYINFWRK